MKIIDVCLDNFRAKSWIGKDKFAHEHPCQERETIISRINVLTDDGITGQAVTSEVFSIPSDQFDVSVLEQTASMSGPDPALAASISKVKPLLVGESPFSRERIFDMMFKMQRLTSLGDDFLALIDLALWDIVGKAAGLPVYKLLGGHRTRLPAYGSIMVGDNIPGGLCTPDDYGRFAKKLISRGYQAIKLHAWMDEDWETSSIAGKPDMDKNIAACRAVRNAVGPTVPLMLDAYHHYDRSEALHLGRELEKLQFSWLEEPMNEYDISSYQWLADHLEIPLIGPETAKGKGQTRVQWLQQGACDICRAGIKSVGGITPLLKIVHLCELHGVPLELHLPGYGTMHVMSAMMIAGKYYERGLLHPFLDYDVTPPWFKIPVDIMDKDGLVLVPDRPGLGYVFDEEYIERHRV